MRLEYQGWIGVVLDKYVQRTPLLHIFATSELNIQGEYEKQMLFSNQFGAFVAKGGIVLKHTIYKFDKTTYEMNHYDRGQIRCIIPKK